MDTWDEFWEGLRAALDDAGITIPDNTLCVWDGTDDSYPKRFPSDSFATHGFDETEFHWQELDDGILSARKSVSLAGRID